MKKIKLLLVAVLAFTSVLVFAQTKTDSFKVYGNCGMCQKRIEKSVKLEGVNAAAWDVDSKIMTVTYDQSKITLDDIQKKIAAVGHDTVKFRAEDKEYDKLPGCCLYDRKKADKEEDHSKHKH